MTITTIKITELNDIGTDLAGDSVLPVVNMTGTPVTEKTVLSNIANLILEGAGIDYSPVSVATIAGTVTTAAQPNITSTGTLTALTVAGNISTAGNLLATSLVRGTTVTALDQLNTANLSSNGLSTLSRINVTTTANLGAVGNVTITGGTSGYVLSTDGTGGLSWVAQSAGSTYGNADVANYLPTFTGNVGAGNVIASGNLYSAGLLSNGVANINSNVVSTNPNTGALKVRGGLGVLGNIHSNNEIHSSGNIIVGGQSLFVGPSADATGLVNPTIIAFHGGATYIQAALKNSLGTGSADWVAYGDNGTDTQGWADFGFTSSAYNDPNFTITGPGDGYFLVETFAGSYGGNLILATGSEGTVRDIIFGTNGFDANNEFGRISDSNNSFEITRTGASLKFPDGSEQTTAYLGGGGNTGNVTFNNINIIGTGNLHLQPDSASAASYLDIFLTSGPDLHLVASNGANLILGKDNQSNVMTSWDGNVYIQSWDNNTNTQGGVWTFDGDGNLTLPNDANIAIYGNTTQFNTCPNGFLGLNSYDAGSNNIARVNISSVDELVSIGISNPITEDEFNWTFATGGGTIFPTVSVQRGDNPSGTITGQTLLFGDSTQEAIISTPDGTSNINSSQRLVINPGAGAPGTGGEGGDIYLWAGRGGNASGSGGDIKIRGGQGGSNTSGGIGGSGGYIRIEAGDSATTGGSPGYVDINGGNSSTAGGGYVEIIGGQGATVGGDANLKGGYGQATGGNVNIWGGASGNGQINEGHVNIQTGGNTWTFDPSGNLTLPSGGSIYSQSSTPSGAPGNTITLQPAGSGITTNQKLLVYPTAGDGDHIHLTSGNLYQTELFLGSDSLFIKLANTGNIVINSDDDAGNTAQWKFGIDGNLTASGNLIIAGNTNVFGTDSALIQPTDDKPLIALSSGANGAVSSVWIEDIGNVGTSNIAAVYANPTPGSKIVRIAVGQNGGNAGPSLWDFNASGALTLPQGSQISETANTSVNITANANTWAFGVNGTLTLPGNTFAINYANGTQVPVGVTQDITSNGAMSIMLYDGNIKYNNYATVEPSTGNIAGGNISATGNISANNFTGNGGGLSNVATKVAGSWTLASGVNTVNISVPLNGTYAIWVNGNIPNGIITYTATAVVTNTNVPVLGDQYGWYYAVGNALVLTSIPNQFVGTAGAISNVNTYVGNTANVFTFGITNNSGNTAVVNYGYTKL